MMRAYLLSFLLLFSATLFSHANDQQQGVTFKVADVLLAKKRLPESSPTKIILAKGGKAVEASSLPDTGLVATKYHPLIEASHVAFADHRPLILSPDMIWLTILQGIAIHVNKHAEELRSNLVDHQGKLHLKVRRDEFVKGSPENDWEDAFSELCQQVAENTRAPLPALLQQRFSTTGVCEQMAFHATILKSVDSYYSYRTHTGCGLPRVTLEGTSEDWDSLWIRVGVLRDLKMEWWLEALRPILAEFSAAAHGKVNHNFWKSMYKDKGQSGKGKAVTGWIVQLFPYILNNRDDYVRNPWLVTNPKRDLGEGPEKGYFPRGLSKVTFTWLYIDTIIPMELLAGLVALEQKKDLSLRPVIGWMIREAGQGETEQERTNALRHATTELKNIIQKQTIGVKSSWHRGNYFYLSFPFSWKKKENILAVPKNVNEKKEKKTEEVELKFSLSYPLSPEERHKRILRYQEIHENIRTGKQEYLRLKAEKAPDQKQINQIYSDMEWSRQALFNYYLIPQYRWNSFDVSVMKSSLMRARDDQFSKPFPESLDWLSEDYVESMEGKKSLQRIRRLFTPYEPVKATQETTVPGLRNEGKQNPE